jgi:hypothetical protein
MSFIGPRSSSYLRRDPLAAKPRLLLPAFGNRGKLLRIFLISSMLQDAGLRGLAMA